jgi:hypothetical protein
MTCGQAVAAAVVHGAVLGTRINPVALGNYTPVLTKENQAQAFARGRD